MSTPRTLHAGDATFAKSFTKISRGDRGEQLSAGFNPPKGREFVVLLLGDVEKGQSWVDIEKMLNDLGFYRQPAAPQGNAGRWVPFAERWPEPNAALDNQSVKTTPSVLLTNNIDARDRMGRMSHVWYSSPIAGANGEVVAFTDCDSRILGVTHWFEVDLLSAQQGEGGDV